MSLENSMEKVIAEAIERGEFDNLKGKGKPLDLNAYFNTPEDVRLGYSVLKANEFVPKEVELLNEVAELRAKVESAECDNERRAATKQLHDRELALRLEIERRRGKRK
jgi:hypothetical protein